MKTIIGILSLLLIYGISAAQDLKEFEITADWISKIEQLAPSEATVQNVKRKKILVFCKATGYKHWITPHNNEMLKILGKKSGLFEIHLGYDIGNFEKENLALYDAIILNNSNPSGPGRDLFSDLLQQNTNLNDQTISEASKKYEQNLINYVAEGGGLMILHGAITVQNNSNEFSAISGGSFDYHPKQQEMQVKKVDTNHPMVQAFKGNGFTHTDEPYFFKNAYFDYNFKPLLYIEADQLEGKRENPIDNIIYISWIKRYKKGRVFYTSPSHNAQSFENPEMLQFILDGMQYVVGDLKCDDSPIGKPK